VYSFFRKLFILVLNWIGKSLSARSCSAGHVYSYYELSPPPTLSLALFRESNGYLTDSPAVSPDPAAGQQQDTTPVRTPAPVQHQRRNSSNSHSQPAAHQQKQHYRNSSLGQQQQQQQSVDHHPLGSTTPAAYPHHRPLEPSLSSENTVQQLFLESVLRGGEQVSANRGPQQQQQGGGVVGRKTSSHSRQASLGGGRQEAFEAPPQQQQDTRHAHNNNNNNKTRTAVVGGDEEGKPQKKKLGVIAALRQSFRRASKKSTPRQQPAQGSSSSLGYLGRASTTSLAVTGRADSQLTPQLSGGTRLKESYSNISVASVKTGRKSIVGKLI
jgi:hypothetical protein